MWGAESQVRMFQEECAEAVVAVNHLERGRVSPEVLAEEVADVEIMAAQMRVILGDEAVDAIKTQKLARLRERLEGK